MAVNMALIEQIVAVVDRIVGQQATAAQQQHLEAILDTLLAAENAILDREQRAIELISQVLARVAANQTQTAANAITLAQTANTISAKLATIPTSSANANAVWSYLDALSNPVIDFLAWAGANAYQQIITPTLRVPGQPFLGLSCTGPAQISRVLQVQPFAPLDPHTILPTDATAADWVQRAYASYGWQPWTNPGNTIAYPDQAVTFAYWVLLLEQHEFDRLKQQYLGAPTAVPPVWPGLSNVTLGTQVAIAPPTQTVPGPMDGVLVQITAVPTPVGYYQFGPDRSYVKIGGVAFQNDDGYDEEAQPVSFQQHIITPRRQLRAQSALFRWVTGVQGTITPWTIT